jgi:hypothetical protein
MPNLMKDSQSTSNSINHLTPVASITDERHIICIKDIRFLQDIRFYSIPLNTLTG